MTLPPITQYVKQHNYGIQFLIRPTDIAASNITSSNGTSFSPLHFYGLGTLSPPQESPLLVTLLLSQKKPSSQESFIQKMLLRLQWGREKRRSMTSQSVQRCHCVDHGFCCRAIPFLSFCGFLLGASQFKIIRR